jgi:hypothetical protein
MKPLALVERAINNSSKPGNVVLDLFLGSGSTLIAAERTGRVCYGMELDPHYGSVVLARWESFSGKTAKCLDAGLPPEEAPVAAEGESADVRRSTLQHQRTRRETQRGLVID